LLDELTEEQIDEIISEAYTKSKGPRIKVIRARIRNGKVQRRKRVSNVPGFKLVHNRLKRMSFAERRHRKMGQRRGKIKRRSKMRRILMKRARSIRRRHAMGLK